MSNLKVINDAEQSALVSNARAKNGEMYLKASGSTNEGDIVVYYNGSWIRFDNEYSSVMVNDYSLSLDGANDYATISGASDLSISGDCTISLWFNSASLPSTDAYDYMFSLTDARATGKDRAIGIIGAGTDAQIVANTYGSGWNLPFTNTSISASTWNHVAVVFTSGSAQVYLNGADKGSKSVVTNTIAYTQTVIGGMLYSSANHFNGLIDEVSVFGSELSSSDVTTIYNLGVPTDISSLSPVGYWKMGDNDGGTGTTITDQGSGSNNATLINGPTFSSSVPS
jgi:hypothetical protein